MKTFDVPDWVIAPFRRSAGTGEHCKLGVFEDDYHLYGACRALGFVRMAAAALEKMGNSDNSRCGPTAGPHCLPAGKWMSASLSPSASAPACGT